MSELSRRTLFRAAGALGVSTTLPETADARTRHHGNHGGHAHPHGAAAAAPAPGSSGFRFFNAREAAFVTAAVDRLIPADERWAGAVGAGVPTYIDGQLAGAYGHGARFYRAGPWETGLPTQGYQLALNPAQLYRTAIAAFEEQIGPGATGSAGKRQASGQGADGSRQAGSGASAFAALPPDQQDARLAELEAGKHDLGGVPSAIFFETLLANTIEGFFSDPVYGGNRDMVGWKMIGFPGAYASFLGVYTNHGQRFEREPMSIAQSDQDRPQGDMGGMTMPGHGRGGSGGGGGGGGGAAPGRPAPNTPARGGQRG